MSEINRNIQPELKKADKINFIKPDSVKLDNRINLHQFNVTDLDFVKIEFVFQAGSKYSKKALLASTVNNMLLEGADNMSSKEISEAFDFLGAEVNSKITKDLATISVTVLNKYFENVLEILTKILFKPNFESKELEIYLKNKKQNFLVNSQKVSYLARTNFLPILFGENHYYGNRIKLSDFNEIDTDDLKEFYRNYYTSQNCDIIVTGKLNSKIFKLINDKFGSDEFNKTDFKAKLYENLKPSDKYKHHINKKDSLQNSLRIGKLVINRDHKDYHDLSIANTVLGGFFGSRLMKNIREDKGYTYGIGSGILNLDKYSVFYITSELGYEYTPKAIDEIHKEIEKLANDGVSNEELSMVTNYIQGALLRKFDGPFNISNSFKDIYFGKLDYTFYEKFFNRTRSIKSNDIQRAIEKYILSDKLYELVVGNNDYKR